MKRILIIIICCVVVVGLTSCEKEVITPDNLTSSDLQLRKGNLPNYNYDASSVEKILEELDYSIEHDFSNNRDINISVHPGVVISYDNDLVCCLVKPNTTCYVTITGGNNERNNSDVILVGTDKPILNKNTRISESTVRDGFSFHTIEQL